MAAVSRILLEVGNYSKSTHFAVIGKPSEFYLWYKPKGQKGYSSKMLSGMTAFQHFRRMHELLNVNKNEEAFVTYLTDLFMANPEISKAA